MTSAVPPARGCSSRAQPEPSRNPRPAGQTRAQEATTYMTESHDDANGSSANGGAASQTEGTSGGGGPLALFIAARGGASPPEAPFVIEHREALIFMLCEAAELEHGIMCQYLYAAFSLKQNEGEDLTAAELAKTR